MRARSASGSSSPTTTDPPTSFRTVPCVAPLEGAYPFAGPLRHRHLWKLAQALLGAARPFLDGIWTLSRSRRSPTSSRSSTRTRAGAPGLRRLAQPPEPGLRALMRAGKWTPRLIDESSIT